ncbi:MAG: DJ-1/PfpI family protein [Candidatus Micrarchaeales archaeon]|jgi:hypothetical protein|uniref:DJ-1/PfpI domain-containing protein n=1 Tax=Candidatus Micrarchaeum acidiphilum ARMAN-2 TaxID=425595 RepID=C7DIE1_MICA2|nr:MAG: hypothetical protein UNLARM2_0833 [Candidatus Micrarchaeum acidiphilum ARMAN-2]MCW6160967.1 DJ-1/PfpI family protein [Candidatus Micrarchaeales archaeon]
MKFLVFMPPKGFRDETVSAIKLLFGRWDIDCAMSSYTSKECVGKHGATYRPDLNTSSASPENYDGIVLADGPGIEDYKLYEFRPLLDLLVGFNTQKKYIIGIDNAIKIISRANIIRDKKVSAPREEDARKAVQLFRGVLSKEPVESSDNLITIGSSEGIEEKLDKAVSYLGVR